MGSVVAWLAVVGLFAAVMVGLWWQGRRVRRRARGGTEAFLGPFEEMWHPAAHRARFETWTVEERQVPMPSPDDRP